MKMKKFQALTYTILIALLILQLTSPLTLATTTQTFTLSSQITQTQYQLPKGTIFNGSISTTGAVRFWVSAPNGSQIVNLGLIDQAATFSFIAKQNGNYTLNFENDLPTEVQVTFSYITNPDISSGNSTGTPIGYLFIPITIAVLGCILIIFLVRRKNKKKE
jgi:hypothetical protein